MKRSASQKYQSYQKLQYQKPTNYCNKVLIGPWVEDRASYTPENHKHTTTYSNQFGRKPYSKIDPARLWDLRLQFEDTNFVSQLGKDQSPGPDYWENFATTYDLSYNHFSKQPIPRRYRIRTKTFEPDDIYTTTYGNATEWGLRNHKMEQWAFELSDSLKTYLTHYQESFTPPEKTAYTFNHVAIPLANSSIMGLPYQASLALRLRGKPLSNVPETDQLVVLERENNVIIT